MSANTPATQAAVLFVLGVIAARRLRLIMRRVINRRVPSIDYAESGCPKMERVACSGLTLIDEVMRQIGPRWMLIMES